MQKYFTKMGNQAEVKLLRRLFDIDSLGNIISIKGLRIVESHRNSTSIVYALGLPTFTICGYGYNR